jgi:hypothetical protein
VQANSTHAAYDAAAPQWSRARDVLGGEDAVKAAGTKYLPRLDSQNDDEYAAYKGRASFFGATARTLQEYLDLVFRRAPAVGAAEGKVLGASKRKVAARGGAWRSVTARGGGLEATGVLCQKPMLTLRRWQ